MSLFSFATPLSRSVDFLDLYGDKVTDLAAESLKVLNASRERHDAAACAPPSVRPR
jgi:hypothetical protein